MTVSGVPRGEQRALYDARRRTALEAEGISLITLSYDMFAVNARKRLLRKRDQDRHAFVRYFLDGAATKDEPLP